MDRALHKYRVTVEVLVRNCETYEVSTYDENDVRQRFAQGECEFVDAFPMRETGNIISIVKIN